MKKVYSITLNYFTHDNRVLKENISLKNNGYVPLVIALHKEGLLEKEEILGVLIHRVKLLSKNWPKVKIIHFFKYIELVLRIIIQYRDADIYHCNDLDALVIGVIIKMFFNKKAKIVYDAHEYEIERDGMGHITRLFCHFLEGILIKHADRVITVSDSIANEYVRLYKIGKPELVLNCPSFRKHIKHDLFRQELNIRKDQKIYLYQGGLSKSRGIEKMIDYFSYLHDDKKVIVFMGYGPLTNKIKNCKSHNVFFHNAVNGDVLLDYTSSADFGLLLLDNVCKSFYYSLPNKLFEYLHAGLPIIVTNLFELGNFVRNNKIGLVANSTKADDIEKAIIEINNMDYDELSKNSNETAELYCWQSQERTLISVYRSLC